VHVVSSTVIVSLRDPAAASNLDEALRVDNFTAISVLAPRMAGPVERV
jgi:hypothetical protein